ncbi:hypothetical protein DET61_1312 [Marinobacter nauticus]|uniref:Uncharacterized protein n=1 Tax=Marinobacter nauticus TaxID=2743 RepID=A0A368X562_MARNT|nr:hypothetical protein [Marinobacter nauticus]RCW62128.1 hypothetical protein DET61_1312 [Marinobacter nauticus]
MQLFVTYFTLFIAIRSLSFIFKDLCGFATICRTLAAEIRKQSRLSGLKVILLSALSGQFNESMVKKVEADKFIAKFNPDELAKEVFNLLEVTSK